MNSSSTSLEFESSYSEFESLRADHLESDGR